MSSRRRLTGILTTLALSAAAIGGFSGTASAEPSDVHIQACSNVPTNTSGLVARFTLYDGTGWTGACTTFWSFDACTATYSDIEGLYNLRGWGWDNRASSVATHNRCDVRLWDAFDCPVSGAHTTWIDRSADLILGGVNWSNRASCLQVS